MEFDQEGERGVEPWECVAFEVGGGTGKGRWQGSNSAGSRLKRSNNIRMVHLFFFLARNFCIGSLLITHIPDSTQVKLNQQRLWHNVDYRWICFQKTCTIAYNLVQFSMQIN